MVYRSAFNTFSDHYKATIGCDFCEKKIELDSKHLLKLQIWDIAGQERFAVMSRVYFKGAVCAAVCFDLTNFEKTLEEAIKWKQEIDSKVFSEDGRSVPVILVANKADLVDHDDSEFIIKLNTLNDIVVKYNFDRWIMTSARTGENVDQLIESLAKHAAELKPLMSENAGTRSQVIVQLESSKSKDSKRIRKRDVIAQNCCKN